MNAQLGAPRGNQRLCFVIIEYHCLDEVHQATESIRQAAAALDYRVVVTSNSTYGDSQKKALSRGFPDVTWIHNDHNLGFAAGINAGLRQAEAEYVVVMNPDVRMRSGGLSEALSYLDAHPAVAVVGPRIVDDQGRLQDSCRAFMTPLGFMRRAVARFTKKQGVILDRDFDYLQIQEVDWVIGAFMLVRKSAIAEVGELDEGFFLYVEDMDWCRRFSDSGCSVVYFPRLVVEYEGDRKSLMPIVSGTGSHRYMLLHLKCYLRFLRKHRFLLGRNRLPWNSRPGRR